MKRNICVRQFECKKFGFYCSEAERELFYVSQWSSNRLVFLIYRIFMWMYAFGWATAYFIVTAIYYPGVLNTSYQFLTNWGDIINAVYFSLALALAAVGFHKRNKPVHTEHVGIKVLRGSMWSFQTVNHCCTVIVTVLYWSAALGPVTPLSVHRHAIILVMMVIDHCFAAHPVRLFHAVYAMLTAAIYSLMVGLLHVTGVESRIYSFIDFANNPGLAAGVAVGLTIPVNVVIHSIFFGLYCLRLFIHSKFCLQNTSTKVSPIPPDGGSQKQLPGSLHDVSSATSSVTLPTENAA